MHRISKEQVFTLAKICVENYCTRTIAISIFSVCFNIIIGTGKLILGILLSSSLYVITGIYYLLLCASRMLSVKRYTESLSINDEKKCNTNDISIYHNCGVFIILLAVSYAGSCIWMYARGDVAITHGLLAYVTAAVSIWKMAAAIIGAVKAKNIKTPIISALKSINFIDAMISIVATVCTLRVLEGRTENVINKCAVLGLVFSVVFLFIGIYMIRRKKFQSAEKKNILSQKRSIKEKRIYQ